MNGKGAKELGQVVTKFKSGVGRSWQCGHCGEVYEDAVPKCSSQTVKVQMDEEPDAPAGAPPRHELRFLADTAKVDEHSGELVPGARLWIGDRVVVRKDPRKDTSSFDDGPRGKLVAVGTCSGSRPPAKSPHWLRGAPGSCFVLVLNPSAIEGLDCPDATHLLKLEPMSREDKEQQAT